MTRVVLVRHAEPLVTRGTPNADWPLTDKGRHDADALGGRLAKGSRPTIVWTSPERKALETAAGAFPSAAVHVSPELGEVTKPWYPTSGALAEAVAAYVGGETVEGWERRSDVMERLTLVEAELPASERTAVVSHGVLITTWLDHALGLEDPFSFWSNLRTPDAWELDLEEQSLQRIA